MQRWTCPPSRPLCWYHNLLPDDNCCFGINVRITFIYTDTRFSDWSSVNPLKRSSTSAEKKENNVLIFLLPHSIRATWPHFRYTTPGPFEIFRSVHEGNHIAPWPSKKGYSPLGLKKIKKQKYKYQMVPPLFCNSHRLTHGSDASVAAPLMWFGITGARFPLNAPIFLPPQCSPPPPLSVPETQTHSRHAVWVVYALSRVTNPSSSARMCCSCVQMLSRRARVSTGLLGSSRFVGSSLNYSTLLLEEESGLLYVGGRGVLYALNTTNISTALGLRVGLRWRQEWLYLSACLFFSLLKPSCTILGWDTTSKTSFVISHKMASWSSVSCAPHPHLRHWTCTR